MSKFYFLCLKSKPSSVILSGHLAIRNPLHTANGNDLAAILKIWRGLFRMSLISVEQKPAWSVLSEMFYYRMQNITPPRGNDTQENFYEGG
jgi:hypothetical protein